MHPGRSLGIREPPALRSVASTDRCRGRCIQAGAPTVSGLRLRGALGREADLLPLHWAAGAGEAALARHHLPEDVRRGLVRERTLRPVPYPPIIAVGEPVPGRV